MTDLEMTKKCAEAMGYKSIKLGTQRGPGNEPFDTVWVANDPEADHSIYQVLSGLFCDAQAMQLLWLLVSKGTVTASIFGLTFNDFSAPQFVFHSLNNVAEFRRAIVECVARMQNEKASDRS